MFARLPALRFLALLPLCASAAAAATGDAAEMTDRYLDVQLCMERTIGKQWHERYGVELAINRWGAVEPTALSIDTAPQIVRLTDLRCRRQRDLAGQPRP